MMEEILNAQSYKTLTKESNKRKRKEDNKAHKQSGISEQVPKCWPHAILCHQDFID